MQILLDTLNAMGLQVNDVLNSIIIFLLIFIFALIGSYLHEIYELIRNKNDKVEVNKIIITSITSTFALFFFENTIIASYGGYKALIFYSFVAGAGGYKYIYKFYNGEILDFILKRFNISIGKKKDNDKNDNEEENK